MEFEEDSTAEAYVCLFSLAFELGVIYLNKGTNEVNISIEMYLDNWQQQNLSPEFIRSELYHPESLLCAWTDVKIKDRQDSNESWKAAMCFSK